MRTWKTLATLGGLLLLANGCAVDTEETSTDEGLALVAPPPGGYTFARDNQEERKGVPVERNAKWQVVYSVPMKDLTPGERIAVRGEVQLTVCQASDIEPSTPCRRIAPFAPTYKVKVILGTSPTDAEGPDLSGVRDVTCTHLKHHCALVVDETVTPNLKGSRFANLVVSAVDGQATDKDLMIVDDHHGGLYVTRIGKGAPVQGVKTPGRVATQGWMHLDMEDKEPRKPHVTLQAKLDHVSPGDVIDVDALIEARTRPGGSKPGGCSGARDPLITNQIFVSRHANDPEGSKIAAVSAKNGSNCAIGDTCNYRKSAALQLPKDTPDTVYVSVVSMGGRSCSAPNDEWSLGGQSDLTVRVRSGK